MAHSVLHFSIGLAVGTAAALPPLVRAWRRQQNLAPFFARWLATAYGLGFLAIVPGLLRRLGLPGVCCDGWWMNVFLFHPLLNAMVPREDMPLAVGALAACFTLHYGLVLLALRRRQRSNRRRLEP